jgi:biotin carboxyl carrier protein
LRRVVPRAEVLPSTRKIIKHADLRHMFKKASNSVCTSTVAVSGDPLSPAPTSSAMKTPESTEKDISDPETADEGDIQMEYSSDQLYSPIVGTVTKSYL